MGRKSKYTPEFKAKVAIEAIKERETLSDLAVRFEVAPSKITAWKNEFLKNSQQAFINFESNNQKSEQEKARLYSKIGQLQVEVDFFAEAYKDAGLKRK